ncbi:MAG TPA: hypothetical protein PLK30_16910 [Blastocatellia bacterium]|nr:hypothetical protein [Blastocatellia bacterium]
MFSDVITKNDLRHWRNRALLVALLLLGLIVLGLALNAVSAERSRKNFEQAADFPRGALVYAQFKDLPGLLRQWNESPVKERYLASVNFQQLQSRHLAMKLLSRWEEFGSAAGFDIDLNAFSSLADNRAAIAVYDIGKLDLVLIAPMSQTKLEVCRFFQGKDGFEEIELPDGTTYYLHDVEADRGRQKQHIAFAYVKGRFVLTTSEQLMIRVIANLNGAEKKDRLTDDLSFQELAKVTEPHFVTVWVEQSKLNDDWYFRHYWLMSNVADLKNMRAGMFDLEMQQDQWVERREYLLRNKPADGQMLSNPAMQRIEKIVPADVPFVQFRSASHPASAAELIRSALFGGSAQKSGKQKTSQSWQNYSDSDFDVPSSADEESFGENRYSYLDHKFDSEVNEIDERGISNDLTSQKSGEQRFTRTLQVALQSARPLVAARLTRPRAIEGPLFAEFTQASVISLQNASLLDRMMLERAIAELAANHLMIAGASGKFVWTNRNAGGNEWREMELPILGRSVAYGVRGNELIISNNAVFLAEMLSVNPSAQNRLAPTSPIHEMTVIRLSKRKQAFDQIFARLEEPIVKAYWQKRHGEESDGPSQEFFSGEVASLLDVASPVTEVRIQRGYANGRMKEEVIARLK